MAYRHPEYPYFTREICKRGILQEPFRLIDIGVLGGIGSHWFNFGDHLQAWGFDVLYEQGVKPLIEANPHPDRLHYLNIGLGEEDATKPFKWYPENPTASHFAASNGTDRVDETWQNVSICRLDSLYADGTIGAVDFMKMDAESYEVEIIKGARQFFLNSGIFGVQSEATFARTPRHPRSQFIELYEQMAPYGFTPYDFIVHRNPRRSLAFGFPEERPAGEYVLRPIGVASIFDFLFLNEIFDDAAGQAEASVDRILKMIALTELYGLQDIGLDILLDHRERLSGRFDVEEGADWLIRERPAATLTYKQYLAAANSADKAARAEPKFVNELVPKWRFDQLEVSLAGCQRMLGKKEILFAEQQRQLAEQRQQIAEANAEVSAMRQSRSWRITAPLRKAASWLR